MRLTYGCHYMSLQNNFLVLNARKTQDISVLKMKYLMKNICNVYFSVLLLYFLQWAVPKCIFDKGTFRPEVILGSNI